MDDKTAQYTHQTENVPARMYTELIRLLNHWPPDIFLFSMYTVLQLHPSMLPRDKPAFGQNSQHATDLCYYCGWARGEQAEQLDVRCGDIALVAEAQATF